MNIWVIGRGYPTPANKMWGSFELEQAKMLARNGHKVSFIALTLSFFDRKDPRGLRSFEEDNVLIHTYSHFYFPGKAGIYLESFEDKCWRKLFKQAEEKSGKPDAIHVHYPSMISSINEIEGYRKQGVKLFATEHWSRVLINNLKKHEKARLGYYATHANCLASVSEALMEAVKKLVNVSVPTEIVPNIVSPLFYSAVKRVKSDESFTFICVGRLVPLKQFDIIVEQFLKEFSNERNVKLKIVGSGSDGKKIKSMAKDSSQVIFTGELSIKDVAQEVADADVLVSFSKYETFAAPVTEAWACGKPTIVSAESGVASFVNAENGIVVSRKDYNALRTALRLMYKNYASYDSANIKEYSKKHFDDGAVMDKLDFIYRNY